MSFNDFAHTGPDDLAGKLLRSFWQPVYLSEDLPVGFAKPITVLGEEFAIYRGESGNVHILDGRCAHRETQLSIGFVEKECLRCFYHGWQYDETGQCVDQAIENPSFARKVKIRSFPVIEYLGLVFAYFGEGEPPPPPSYPEFEGDDVVVHLRTNFVNYNYFQNMENSVDTLHVSYVHRMSSFFAESRGEDFGEDTNDVGALEGSVTDIRCEETEYGFQFDDVFENGSTRTSYFEMPNALHIKVAPISAESGWLDFCAWKVPIDAVSYRNFNFTVAHVEGDAADRYRNHPRNRSSQNTAFWDEVRRVGDEILAGKRRLTVEDCGDLALTVPLQDYIAQRGQGEIADRVHEQLGRSDKVVILLRNLYAREMEKISLGEPVKRWRWPGFLEPTSGA